MSVPLQKLPKHLEDLNPEQLTAVRHGEGPLLIFAGAGSGKTRVLTRRIANLISEYQVSPERILAVTFTNKAATEMKARVNQLFNGQRIGVWVSTFHSLGAQILRRHAEDLNYTSDFAIYDSSDSRSALKRAYKKLNIDPKLIDPKMVASRIDKAKNNYHFPDQVRNDAWMPSNLAETIADLYQAYQDELHSSNAMDFGDLIANLVTLFKLEPKILEHYQQKFSYISVDEYQDTNKVQYMLIRMLTEKNQNLCVVGDDDQSIYAFRGATIENILNFKKDYVGTKVVTLETNYRSSRNILEAANAVIAKNKRRQIKEMKTENPSGEPILNFIGYSEKEEAEFVSQEISLHLRKGVKPSAIAVFYRTNAQSRAVEEALCEEGIPYEIFGGHKFYDRKEVKDILAYFRLCLNPADNEAFLRIINTPARGIGNTSIAKLIDKANKEKTPLFKTLEQGLSLSKESGKPLISKAADRKLTDFCDLLANLTSEAQELGIVVNDSTEKAAVRIDAFPSFLKKIAEQSGYLAKLNAEDTQEAESRIENIFELFNVAKDFSAKLIESNGGFRLVEFLERASLTSDLDSENIRAENVGDNNGIKEPTVSLMTLHLAKGLEFDVVFFIGLEEGLIPHVRSLDDNSALEEERRLCYVGITRAKKQLYLSRALSRQSFGRNGNYFSGEPSRFMNDLPPGLIRTRGSLG